MIVIAYHSHFALTYINFLTPIIILAVDFFNEIQLIWDIVCDQGIDNDIPAGEGFPAGYEYRWSEGTKKSTIQCSGPRYIEYVLGWAEEEINKESIFPTSSDIPFPRNFIQTLKIIYTRFFRIFAIIYSNYFSKLESMVRR